MQISALKGRTYAIIDTETTGTSPGYNQIIEIGIIRVEDGKIVKKYQSLIQPGKYIPPGITMITGISDEDLQGAPTFEEVALEVRELLEGAIFVAHNARFDYAFIKNEFKRLGMSFTAKTLCTVRLSRTLFPQHPRHNLDEIIARYKIPCPSRHRAYDDALVLWHFFKKIDASVEPDKTQEAIASMLGSPSLPSRMNPALTRSLSRGPGVYLFYDENKEVIYVGKSINIRSRVLSHFSSDHSSTKELRMCEKVASIECRETSGELSALILESKLIKELMPLYNRALRRTRSFALVTKRETDEGYHSLDIGYHDEIPESTDLVLAVFRTVRQAKEFIETSVREFELCPKVCGIENTAAACFQHQLEKCKGACINAEIPEFYNARFGSAFAKRRIKTWPFEGPVIVKEDPEASDGIAFVVDTWRVVKSIHYSDESFVEDDMPDARFDFDTYKILVRHFLKKEVRTSIIPYEKRLFLPVGDESFATII